MMRFSGVKIGFALTGSHCTIAEVLKYMQQLKDEGATIIPVISPAVATTDSRYGKAKDIIQKITEVAGEEPMTTIVETEQFGPQKLADVVLVAPCTGNTLAKLALGITDTSVTMACKAELRNNRPVVIAIATNDGMGTNSRNLGMLLNKKNVFFVPFGQDDSKNKQTSLIAKMDLISEAIAEALEFRQLQPLFVKY